MLNSNAKLCKYTPQTKPLTRKKNQSKSDLKLSTILYAHHLYISELNVTSRSIITKIYTFL